MFSLVLENQLGFGQHSRQATYIILSRGVTLRTPTTKPLISTGN